MWFQPFCNRLKIAAIIIIENRGKSTTNSNTLNIVWCCHEANNNNNNNKYVSAKRKTGFWINDWTNDESKREWKKLIGYTFAVCKIKKNISWFSAALIFWHFVRKAICTIHVFIDFTGFYCSAHSDRRQLNTESNTIFHIFTHIHRNSQCCKRHIIYVYHQHPFSGLSSLCRPTNAFVIEKKQQKNSIVKHLPLIFAAILSMLPLCTPCACAYSHQSH